MIFTIPFSGLSWANLITGASLLVLLVAVLSEFLEAKASQVMFKEKSFVSISFMGIFFIVELLAGRYGIGRLQLTGMSALSFAYLGCAIVVLGVALNLIARIELGEAWSNDIVIYQGHQLHKSGLYHYVRHPLYSSIILIAFGLSLLYADYLSFILTCAVFIPMIYYRTVKEEVVLYKHLSGYSEYAKTTSMFAPFSFHSFFSVNEVNVNRLALRLCRATTVILLLISMVVHSWWLVGVVLILMLYSAFASIAHSPLVLMYSQILKGSRWSKIESVDLNAIRMAQGIGSILLITAFLLFFVFNHPLGAWITVLIVMLSTAFGSFGYCLGAYIYFGLRRLYAGHHHK